MADAAIIYHAAGGCAGQAERKEGKTKVMLTGADAKNSVVTTMEGSVYTPYGYNDGGTP